MGRAVEIGLREQLIACKLEGASLQQISLQLNLPLATVRKLSAQYKHKGHLAVAYPNCGPRQLTTDPTVVRAARWLKRHHPDWGAPLIRLKLVERYGQQATPASRSLQRWFAHWQLTPPRQQVSQPRIGQARAVHNIWQVDAKENLRLADDSSACYLTIVDEHSGAALAAPVFPLRTHQSGASGTSQTRANPGVSALGQAGSNAG